MYWFTSYYIFNRRTNACVIIAGCVIRIQTKQAVYWWIID